MGVASFLLSVWRSSVADDGHPSLPPPLKALPTATLSATLVTTSSPDSPRAPKNISFTLPEKLYTWLETMALLHNYGSVHKSIRDLLVWASAGQDEDLDWLFCTPHEVAACIDIDIDERSGDAVHEASYIEASCIAEKQAYARLRPQDDVTLDARVSDHLSHWIAFIVQRYSLRGPSDVLEALCRCAIVLRAADDVFESDESGHDLPESTAELYHDLGLIRFVPTPALSTPPPSPP